MKKKVLVYRIENCRGQGAYDSCVWKRRSNCDHPLPDYILGKIRAAKFNTYDFFYGFISKKQLKAWFWDSDRLALDRDGFFISVYEVPTKYCFFDKYQAAFLKKRAKFIQDYALSAFD